MHHVLVWYVTVSEHDLVNVLRPAELLKVVLGYDWNPGRIVRARQ